MSRILENLDKINEFIFTAQSGSEAIARNEILKLSENASLVKKIDKGVELVRLSESYLKFFEKIKPNNFIFVRHMQPVNISILANVETLLFDILNVLNNYSDILEKNISFSVQTRILNNSKLTIKPFEINEKTSEFLIKRDFVLDVNNPKQIISILIDNEKIYFGFSNANQNLSNWSGGNIRFIKDDNLISRAEFKILEAINVFNLQMENYETALDLGAAPGGWTKALVKIGMKVIAVDPAELSEFFLNNKNIIHKKITAQAFFEENKDKFDIITNDMKMDFRESIDIMILAKKFISENGIFIITLKLPEKNQQKNAYLGLKIIEKYFKIIGARQLFHNRSEITVVFENL